MLVIVHPMTSYSGSIAYLEYVSNTNKGTVKKGDIFNSVFKQGEINDGRVAFTSQAVVERADLAAGATEYKFMWQPVLAPKGTDGLHKDIIVKDLAGNIMVEGTNYTVVEDSNGNAIGIANGGVAYSYNVGYKYNQEYIPAEDIPTIGPKMRQIALVAEPRRIAVKYDQITAFQAKQDYGFSLDKQIAEQACGELAYEIDTDILDMLIGAAEEDSMLVWSKALPVGVSKFEHFNGFLEIFERAKAIIYKRTQKFHPNYMVVAADVLPVLTFVNGFKANNVTKMNGPYKVGSLNGVDVYVSPRLDEGKFFFGLCGNDMMSAAGVYAPYMAIVPTQLLGTPDGMLQQGFSTWYSKKLLSTYKDVNGIERSNLLVAGRIVY